MKVGKTNFNQIEPFLKKIILTSFLKINYWLFIVPLGIIIKIKDFIFKNKKHINTKKTFREKSKIRSNNSLKKPY